MYGRACRVVRVIAIFAAALAAGLPLAKAQLEQSTAPAASNQSSSPPHSAEAERFLAARGWKRGQRIPPRSLALRNRTLAQRQSEATSFSSSTAGGTWSALGPTAVSTSDFGLVTGRVTSIVIDPSDTSGNTIYVGTTGGGVWKSTAADASSTTSISFSPLTDSLSALGGAIDSSISIGAVTVQPGGTGVILAGTGDPNDVLDSYYGAGILRSTDGGNSWSLIRYTSDVASNLSTRNYSFEGEGFAGFAWSTTNSALVVAAVSQAYEGTLVDAQVAAASYEGLYYSADSGATWHLATITDGSSTNVQGPTYPFDKPDGNAATAVVWNPVWNLFLAAVRYHGYYASPDGVTWTRLPNQPGSYLTTTLCPNRAGRTGSTACPIFRGALAVNPTTGAVFAWTVDRNNQDQGLWQGQCGAMTNGVCDATSITFATQWSTSPLETNTTLGAATIADGGYNLTLAAVPSGSDTLLFAGAHDLWKCGPLSAKGCTWRNTTNSTVGFCSGVGEFQHALAWNASNPDLIFIGNDSGLWRSIDAIDESGSVCSATDANHFQNLNSALGSLAEVVSLSPVLSSPYVAMAGLGVNGTAATSKSASGVTTDWPQIITGYGGPVAIDPKNTNNWYVNDQAGVGIYLCSSSSDCTAAAFGASPAVTNADVSYDGNDMGVPAPFLVDPLDDSQLLIGTCRVWRGPVSGTWSTSKAISPILDSKASTYPCDGNGLIRSLAALKLSSTTEIVYAGLYGEAGNLYATGSSGGLAPGHVYSATYNSSTGTASTWSDLTEGNVTGDSRSLNYYSLDISSIVIDSHDSTGSTVYVTVEGIENLVEMVQTVYRSTDGGTTWDNISSNLPETPVSALAVDPQNANVVYVATDVGVYYTTEVANCATANADCWAVFGSGLPEAPVVALSAAPSGASKQVLVAATYGRGIWQTALYTANTLLTSATVNPLSLTFSNQTVNTTSSAQTLTVTNTGSLALTPSSIAITGDFNETDTCQGQTIAPGSTCNIYVTFTPLTAGAQSGVLTLYANIYGGQLTVDLNGTGTGSTSTFTLSPGSLSFGDVEVGATSAGQQVTAANSSTAAAVTLTSISITAPFIIVSGSNSCGGAGSTIAVNSDCSLQIEFAPTAAGSFTGQLIFVDSMGTQTVTLTGNGETAPTDTLSTTSLTFPDTAVGQLSIAQTVTITNSGEMPLTGIAISVSSEFEQSNTCGAQLAAGATCTISVLFAPTQLGAISGTLTITDALQTQTVSLNGTGTASGKLNVNPTALNFYSTAVGTASPAQTVTVTNETSSTIATPIFAIAAPFSISATTCTSSLAANGACTVSIVYTPTSSSTASGTLTVSSTSVSGSAVARLTGNVFDFTVAFYGSGSKSVIPGQTANYTLVITPAGASATFVYACGTLPTGALCTFSPTSETLSSGVSGNVAVAISTTAASAQLQPFSFRRVMPLACVLLLVPLALCRRRKIFLLVLMGIWLVGGLSSCLKSGIKNNGSGGSGGGSGTPTGTYTIPITVTADDPTTGASTGISHSVTATMVVD
jgi:hypothetical protein